MKTVLVASSKGGVGKTTLSTNLAAHFAVDGKRTVLVDADRQGSSRHWAEKRAAMDHAVLPLDGTRRDWDKQLPGDAQRVVVDAAAGAHGAELAHFLDVADAVVVPVLPSMIDIEATVPFLNTLAKHPRVRKGKLPVGPGRQPPAPLDQRIASSSWRRCASGLIRWWPSCATRRPTC